jgi:hypothetical protein
MLERRPFVERKIPLSNRKPHNTAQMATTTAQQGSSPFIKQLASSSKHTAAPEVCQQQSNEA